MPKMSLIRKYTNLIYKVAASVSPKCYIRRDPLHHLYPTTNYGVEITLPSLPEMESLAETMKEALEKRGIGAEIRGFIDPHSRWLLHVWPYPEGPVEVKINRDRNPLR